MSSNKLASQLGMHKETAEKYLSCVLETFLLFEVPFFSLSAKTKYIGARASKYYVVDNGLHNISSLKKNKGVAFENLVAQHLRRTYDQIYYWAEDTEIDFVVDHKAIQVTATDNIPQRETDAFASFEEKFKKFKKVLITPSKKTKKGDIEILPLKEFID